MVSAMKIYVWVLVFLTGCASVPAPIYQQVGGEKKMAEIVDYFIDEIGYDKIMMSYFKDSDIERFREKMNEHLCFLTGGGCHYSGDSMEQVHAGFAINESDFNHGVDLFVKAMQRANVPHPLQNKILSTMAPLRGEMIYK